MYQSDQDALRQVQTVIRTAIDATVSSWCGPHATETLKVVLRSSMESLRQAGTIHDWRMIEAYVYHVGGEVFHKVFDLEPEAVPGDPYVVTYPDGGRAYGGVVLSHDGLGAGVVLCSEMLRRWPVMQRAYVRVSVQPSYRLEQHQIQGAWDSPYRRISLTHS